jgi:hypothetical protein
MLIGINSKTRQKFNTQIFSFKVYGPIKRISSLSKGFNSMSKWLKGLRRKLLSLVGLAIVFLATVGFSLNWALENSLELVTDMSTEQAPRVQMINDLSRSFWITNQRLWRTTSIQNVDMRKVLAQYVTESGLESEKLIEQIKVSPGLEKSLYTSVSEIQSTKWPKAKVAIEEALEILKSDSPDALEKGVMNLNSKVMPEIGELEKSMNELLAESQLLAKARSDKDLKTGQVVGFWAKIGSALSCFLLVSFGVWMASSMARQLSQISEGIGLSTAEVHTASSQLSDSSHELSAGANEAAASLEETVASLEEMSSMVKKNAENAKVAGEVASRAVESAHEGEKHIETLAVSMQDIATSSKKMEDIINVIDDIAFQTNLLALNAAVEAARAGEQGRGFAVVADAVRSLAQRSAEAAKGINQLIKSSIEKVQNGTVLTASGQQALKKIVSSIHDVQKLNEEISVASHEQSQGISQISTAMNQIDKATQSNTHTADQTSKYSKDLAEESKLLEQQVQMLLQFINGGANPKVTHKVPQQVEQTVVPLSNDRQPQELDDFFSPNYNKQEDKKVS